MSDQIVVGLIGFVGGIAGAVLPLLWERRKHPSRITTDAVSLVDASGQVISNLTEEIHRLEGEVEHARSEARANKARIIKLEDAMVRNGMDPSLVA